MTQSDTVTEVIDGRGSVYGDPRETFPRVAQVWSGIAGTDITAEQVALMLIGHKLVRAAQTPNYSDNSDDVEGYLDIFRKIVGDDMVHARTVSEYLAELERRKSAAPGNPLVQQPVLEQYNRTRVLADGTELYGILPSQLEPGDFACTFGNQDRLLVVGEVWEHTFRVTGEDGPRSKELRTYEFWRTIPKPSVKTEAQSRANAAGA